jgi:hypothetical protein
MRQQLACRTRIEVNGFFSFVLHDHRITAIGQWPELADGVDIQDVSGTEPDEIRLWHWIIPWRLAGGHAPSVQQARFLLIWRRIGSSMGERCSSGCPARRPVSSGVEPCLIQQEPATGIAVQSPQLPRGLDQQRERSPIDQEKPGRVNLSSIIAVAACPPRATHRRCNAGYQRTAVRHSADVRRWER